MKLDKKQNRLRRARKGRAKIRELVVNRLSVHRTPRHIYAQIIAPDGGSVLVSASTVEQEVRKGVKNGGNVEAASIVGASRRKPRLPASTPSPSIARVFVITGASRHWPMRRVKQD
jgi:ribosomal protein L18